MIDILQNAVGYHSGKRAFLKEIFGDYAEDNILSFSAYFKVYDRLINPQHTIIQIHAHGQTSHYDIWKLSLELRADPQSTRESLRDRVFTTASPDSAFIIGKENAINAAVQLMLMIDCADRDHHSEGYYIGDFRPVSWQNSERFSDFVSGVFPVHGEDNARVHAAMREKNALKGWKLKKRAHVKFLPTDNLAEHLLYDPRDNTLRIFHHTAFLKAHLLLSATMPTDCGITECLKL